MKRTTTVEICYFEGCPNVKAARELVERAVKRAGVDAEIEEVLVDESSVEAKRFLGSPAICVEGADVEPGAEGRRDYGLKCRIYVRDGMTGGLPDEEWVVEALRKAAA